ncbi:hypothetical protein GNP81_05970 [Aliivibrio fischeri]|uniref:hypothetical protein n=1 Tax=Aliivibrio fischeri TaxID=668 RepID=UPI00080E3FE0|nr:hypothetical protein [Aliivibrio fischeri]MUJ38156.1 hypothetical protein [Aliivibrio fischeri]MUK63005.1 hypothetical protein [Aliivibrio fischeri]MUK69932.1 hypothetical protein [Aliivibrio fischeri]MUK72466.1 hypothetical protein [Aliivibrio fischeri]MUL20378.1 hypothetical protein [Aliivibrio fischeri]
MKKLIVTLALISCSSQANDNLVNRKFRCNGEQDLIKIHNVVETIEVNIQDPLTFEYEDQNGTNYTYTPYLRTLHIESWKSGKANLDITINECRLLSN